MASDIVQRLRSYGGGDRNDYRHVAAAHIESQALRIAELEKALRERDEEIVRYQGLLDAAIDDYNNARNTTLEEAAKLIELILPMAASQYANPDELEEIRAGRSFLQSLSKPGVSDD